MPNIITLPGLIDPHVHLRTPGQEYKEDFTSGTAAAIAGGFTTVLDMPNNLKPITTIERLEQKRQLASEQVLCDIGFYFGTDGTNFEEFEKVKDEVMGLKIFLNPTTGHLMIENETIVDHIVSAWTAKLPILFHAEEEKVDLVISLAKKYNKKMHICHISTRAALEKIIKAKAQNIPVTCGVTPHHLFLTETVREKRRGFVRMKPELEAQKDVDFLWDCLDAIDVIESDHAPHTIAEKQSNPPPSGVPGLETTLPLLLTAVHEHRLTIDDIKRLCYENSAEIFNIKKDNETKIEIDLDEKWIVENEKLQTKCKWSPYSGWLMQGKVKRVFIRGTKVFEDDKILVEPGFGKILP